MKHIEILIPCYNEQECVKLFYNKVEEVFEKSELLRRYEHSYLYIDDGSSDNTLEIMRALSDNNRGKIRYISFSKNFGKEAALYAGFEKSNGDYVIVMDADLQHPPALIPEMIDKLDKEGLDCVGARRVSRKGEGIIKSFFSSAFYYVINWTTGMNLVPGMTDFRIMKKNVVDALVSMHERERFIKGLYSWVGFKTGWIEYENVERIHGKSKWSFKSLWNYAKSGFIAFAVTPLRGVVYLGMLVVIASLIYGVRLYYMSVTGLRPWQDTTTIILLLLFIGGTIITVLGLIGEYIARIYMETKQRPIYIARESSLDEDRGNIV